VKRLAAVTAEVVTGIRDVVGIKQRVQEIVGVAVIAEPAGQSQLVPASHEVLEVLVDVASIDGNLNADPP
jgi:hypothetical protein